MKYNYRSKIYFIFLTSFLFWYSCASNKPNETENHPEIEKLWVQYFENLNSNNYKNAVTFLHSKVLFSFKGTGIEIEGSEKLQNQLVNWKNRVDEKGIYLKLHDIKSEKVFDDVTMVDVVKGEYLKNSDKFLREIRRFYHFYNYKETGWKLYMIAGAETED